MVIGTILSLGWEDERKSYFQITVIIRMNMHMNNTNRSSGSVSTGMITLVGAGEGRWNGLAGGQEQVSRTGVQSQCGGNDEHQWLIDQRA